MSPTPPRNTPQGRIYNDLRNLARHHHRDVAEYLTLYALEGLLDRLSVCDKERHLVLKGGVLLAAFAARRPTRDIDLVGSGLPNDITECERVIGVIAAIPIEDGLTFDLDSVHGESIRDEADYPGVRVHLVAGLATQATPRSNHS